MPPASSVEREEERRLNTRTLGIASVASATAAAVTSQLWIAGTWVAAALTPVLVALISEAMHRPTERIARAWTTEREEPAPRASTTTRAEPAAVTGAAGPVRVYRQTSRGAARAPRTTLERPTTLSRRRIAMGGVAVTAVIAFAIAVATITAGDLVSGGSIGKGSSKTTFFSGKKSDRQEQQSTPDQGEATQPSQPGETQTQTETAPPEEEPPPTDTAPAPTPTAPAPSGEPLPETPTSP
jgi:hypothetical protein